MVTLHTCLRLVQRQRCAGARRSSIVRRRQRRAAGATGKGVSDASEQSFW